MGDASLTVGETIQNATGLTGALQFGLRIAPGKRATMEGEWSADSCWDNLAQEEPPALLLAQEEGQARTLSPRERRRVGQVLLC